MLTMLLCSLNHEQAYKDFWTSYTTYALLLALKSIYLRSNMIFGRNQRKLNQEVFYSDNNQIEITYEYINTLGLVSIHMVTLSHLVKGRELEVWKTWWACP
jgi:hypothetical protein